MKKLYIGIISVVAAAGIFAAGFFAGSMLKDKDAEPRPETVASDKSGVKAGADSGQDKAKYISEETAKKIALEKAGLSEDEVRFIKVEFEKDDGIYIYDVEFEKDYKEYSTEIKADSGEILDWDVDIDD